MRLATLISLAFLALSLAACESSPPAHVASTSTGFASVSSGYKHACELRADGSVVCWGSNEHRQSSPTSQGFTSIDSGAEHTCGLRADGSVLCWGNGTGNSGYQAPPPEGETFSTISSGVVHSCGLRPNGSALCWEGRYSGYTGDAAPPEGEVFIAVSSGFYQTCGLRANGSAVCWWNFGTLEPGASMSDDILSMISVYGQTTTPEGEKFVAISVGEAHTCGLRADGSGTCWWSVDLPRLLRDNPGFQSVFDLHDAVSWPDGEIFTAISSGALHTCGLRSDGSVLCWGNIGRDQAALPEGDVFVAISSGYDFVCGLRQEGTVVCRGREQVDVD